MKKLGLRRNVQFCTMPIIMKVKSLFYFLLKSNLSNDNQSDLFEIMELCFLKFFGAVFIFISYVIKTSFFQK